MTSCFTRRPPRDHLFLWGLAAVLMSGCGEDEALAPAVPCPNEAPSDAASCPEPGLVCHYFTGCGEYFAASCEPDGRWSFRDGCAAGGAGGAPTTRASSGGGGTREVGGGGAGEGGQAHGGAGGGGQGGDGAGGEGGVAGGGSNVGGS